MSRIVVTGAAGFIGSHLCERLVADGHRVLGIDAFRPTYPRDRKERNVAGLSREPSFSLHEADLAAGNLAGVLHGAQVVIHLAGRPGARGEDRAPFERDNVQATAAVVAACREAKVGRLVLGSSSSVYGSVSGPVSEDAKPAPVSPYAETKLAAERLAHAAGLELVVLRYFTVYGPRQRPDMAFARFIDAALTGAAAPLLGDGSQVRDFTFVGDAVEATVRAAHDGRPGTTYNVAGSRPARLSDALELLAAQLGRPVPLRAEPTSRLDPRRTHADLSRARRDLGWEPTVGLEEGIAAQVAAATREASAIS
jgi:UDP-glucuronate 4-epimerase